MAAIACEWRPVTGQAAWYDLRVRIDRVAPGEAHDRALVQDPEHPASLGRRLVILPLRGYRSRRTIAKGSSDDIACPKSGRAGSSWGW